MTVITKEYIDHHCKTLSISREELTDFTIPDGVTEIGNHAFRACTTLESITIPNGAFDGCTSLTSITIPDSVTEIGNHAFQACTTLESIIIPDSVTTIGMNAFGRCTSLTSITLPNGVTEISRCVFLECNSLTSITIPDGVTSIGTGAFYRCTSLTSIIIPESVTTIAKGAFEGCSSLTSVTIPDSVTEIDVGAFIACTSLQSITIPNGVTEIVMWAFYECNALESITIPDGITKIGQAAFVDCTSVQSITIPDSVTKIGISAFDGCTALTQVICNNPDLFTDQNTQNRDQIQFISTTEYFKENYQELLIAIEDSEFKSNHVSSKELNLIMKLHQEDFLPDWKTLATTFNERSIDQIDSILNHFNKTCNAPVTEKTMLFQQKNGTHMCLNGISMFLNPKEHTNLYMTANDIIATTPTQEQDQPLVDLFNRLIV